MRSQGSLNPHALHCSPYCHAILAEVFNQESFEERNDRLWDQKSDVCAASSVGHTDGNNTGDMEGALWVG